MRIFTNHGNNNFIKRQRQVSSSSRSPEPTSHFALHEALSPLFAPSITGRELWCSEHRDDIKARVSDFTKYQTVVKEMWDALGDEARAGYSRRAADCHMDVARCVTDFCVVSSRTLSYLTSQTVTRKPSSITYSMLFGFSARAAVLVTLR